MSKRLSLLHILQKLPIGVDYATSCRLLPEAEEWFSRERVRLQDMYKNAENLAKEALVGCDEAGRGPLAGPLTAGAVILKPDTWLPGLNDSKKLKEEEREILAAWIKKVALTWAVIVVPLEGLNNIRTASLEGMRAALHKLEVPISHVAIDGNALIPDLEYPQSCVIKGDGKIPSIAAASILAKVERDRLMSELDTLYPQYGFIHNKGYGSAQHLEALHKYGPSPCHRLHFAPVRSLLSNQGELF